MLMVDWTLDKAAFSFGIRKMLWGLWTEALTEIQAEL